MHNFETSGDSVRWTELVDHLEGRLDKLARTFTARVREIPEYGESQVTVLEIRETARETFRRLIHGLRGGQSDNGRDGLLTFASDLGSKRARAGIPPESLTAAVRLDFSILWAELLEIAVPDDAGLLASRVDQVWRVVDEFATRTHMSYLTERVRMAQEESSIQREFIARLFNQSTLSAETSGQVGSALGISPDSWCGLVAANGEAGAKLRAASAQFGSGLQLRHRMFLHESGGTTYLFWPLQAPRAAPRRGAAPDQQLPPALADIPCGFVPEVHGLRSLPAAARTAESLAALLRPNDPGPLSADAAWARLANQSLQDAGLDLAAQVEESLEDCRGGERERLMETVQHFLSSGNITATAEQLFCHRNTILNRLNRFQELTGIDLTVPSKAARLVVAWA
ncbi:helix-turn-helix domain-containing protein [Arthrobacter sp. B10-11]|uniref:PucR family transcriptional regulator n=1 Tax=Arthrobacter sp. B10-11 TaxID=3081160 RepID=UPI0029553787|nr:helix-turn-helix domain-containing protein [Arthrobacter sp. B10-11]MDV8147299.1 helix-turn-helix domain-containing protein [Arthrobacter sp. B10-11]